MRDDLDTPDLHLPICRLPADSPDCNADEASWAWVRADVTAKTCLGTRTAVQEQVGHFFDARKSRTEEVQTRCRTRLQALAAAVASDDAAAQKEFGADHVVLTCASV